VVRTTFTYHNARIAQSVERHSYEVDVVCSSHTTSNYFYPFYYIISNKLEITTCNIRSLTMLKDTVNGEKYNMIVMLPKLCRLEKSLAVCEDILQNL